MEISRITKFIVDRSSKCTLKIRGLNYRRSPLVQGGLEVPCEVTIAMIGSVVNHLLLTWDIRDMFRNPTKKATNNEKVITLE